jgi:hypothetical protein
VGPLKGAEETPHPHHKQNVGPPTSSLGHPLPTGERKASVRGARQERFLCPLAGERVAAMRRRVRGPFSTPGAREESNCRKRQTVAASPAEPGCLPTD